MRRMRCRADVVARSVTHVYLNRGPSLKSRTPSDRLGSGRRVAGTATTRASATPTCRRGAVVRSAAFRALAHDIGRPLGTFARRTSTGASGAAVIAGTTPAVSGAAAVSATIPSATVAAGTRATTAVTVGGTRLARPNGTGGREASLSALRDVEVGEEVR